MFWRFVAIGYLAVTTEVLHSLFGGDDFIRKSFHLIADITRPWR